MTVYREPVRVDFWQLARNADGSYVDPMGPKNCMTHTAARAAMRAAEGVRPAGISGVWPPTGYAIRRYTGDDIAGVNHGQVAQVLAERYGITYTPFYRFDFDNIPELLEDTRGVGLSLGYDPIRRSSFRGSTTFRDNHEIWLNEWDPIRKVFRYTVDPLADGRQGLFKGPGDYPFSLLREAAGELNVGGPAAAQRLGAGLAYIAITRATGGAPIPAPAPTPLEKIPMNVLDGKTVNAILTAPTLHMRLPKDTPIYRTPGGARVTKASRDMTVPMTGYPGTGWRTIVVATGNFPDGITRVVEAYVPKNAGQIF